MKRIALDLECCGPTVGAGTAVRSSRLSSLTSEWRLFGEALSVLSFAVVAVGTELV